MLRLSKLGETVSRLAAQHKTFRMPAGMDSPLDHGVLVPAPAFTPNPGALEGRAFVPDDLPAGAPLVVVLHGCTQTAAGYDRGSGWSTLAAEAGFAVLFPEQTRANNPNLCFNWFVPGDVTRGQGEVESIRRMIAAMVTAHAIDPARIFVTGLSAGGAMTASMLATSPELFAGGAIIAGVPHGAAGSVNEAFDRMRGNGLPDAAGAAAIIRDASPHQGSWPRLSVWHGSADETVDAANAEAIAVGWARLNGLGAPAEDIVEGHQRRVWRDNAGHALVESITVAGMGHGVPIDSRGEGAIGRPGPHMLEAGIASTRHIAAFWGIAPAVAETVLAARAETVMAPRAGPVMAARAETQPRPAPQSTDVGEIINAALRQAGLMR